MDVCDPYTMLPPGYEVSRRAIRLGAMTVEMLVVTDPNQLAMEVAAEEFADDERLPYWAELWPSAVALSRFLERLGRLDGVDVVELGCGMGLAGVVAATLGADVLFTDFEPDALAFAAANHALNCGSAGDTLLVDWRNPPAGLTASLVLGADVVYEDRFLDPFVATLQTVVKPGGSAFIAEPDRRVATGVLEGIERSGFGRILHMEEVKMGGATYPIWIHELLAPGS